MNTRLTREGQNRPRKPRKHRSMPCDLWRHSVQDQSANPALRGLTPRRIGFAGFETPQASAKPRRNDLASSQVIIGPAGFAGFAGFNFSRARMRARGSAQLRSAA